MKKFKWHIDRCDEFGLKGWIIAEDSPNESIQIDIFIDEKFLCNTTTDIFRPDVLAAFGNGNCGFLIPIPNEFYNDTEHKFNLGYSGLFIPEAVKTVLLKKKLPLIKGQLDECDKEKGITGWVINENNLQEPIDIDVFIDDKLFTRLTANLFRQDILDAKIGNGNCAFSVPVPDTFWDGIEHSVNIYAVVTNTVLSGCPKTFQFSNKFVEKIDTSIKTDKGDIDTLRLQVQELKEENKILLLQLHKIQEKLEQLYKQQQLIKNNT